MFKFQHPYYLYALLLIPVMALLFAWVLMQKKKIILQLGDAPIVKQLFPDYSSDKYWLKFIVVTLSFAFIVLGIANPQVGNKIEKVKRRGVDVIVALDVSRSMNAEDVQPSRLARAKQTISELIDQLENDRIGLVVFAGRSYLQMPVTTDYAAAKMYLSAINTDLIANQGTDIASAIDVANQAFPSKEKKYKALIIITDGEDHEENAVLAAKEANDNGVIINTVGIGMPEGAPIPVYSNGTNLGYKKDNNGGTVISKLNESVLKAIAQAGKGNYYHLGNTQDEVKAVATSINKMEQRTIDDHQFTDYESYFQYFLLIGLVLLVIEFLLFETKTKWLKKVSASFILILTLTCIHPNTSSAQWFNTMPERYCARQGLEALKQKNYTRADSCFDAVLKIDKKFAEAYFNYGNSKYAQQAFDTARVFYQKAIAYFKDPVQQARAYYNIGNCYMENREYETAIQYYRKALLRNANDLDSRYNMAYAKALLENEKRNNKSNKNKNQQKQQQEPKPSALALQMKKKADELIAKRDYSGALNLMEDAMKKDTTIKIYHDYMQRLKDVIEINK